jgi:hypothetical protein
VEVERFIVTRSVSEGEALSPIALAHASGYDPFTTTIVTG